MIRDKNGLSYFISLLLILILFPGCATKMSLEEAKKVSVLMAQSPAFSPPPRRIDDVLSILDQPGQFESKVTEHFKAWANKTPPDTKDERTLKAFYRDRGEAEFELGRYGQAKEDMQKALDYNIKEDSDGHIMGRLGYIEGNYGNFRKAIELFKESSQYPGVNWSSELMSGPMSGSRYAYSNLVRLYTMVGDLESAKSTKRDFGYLCSSPPKIPEVLFFCDFFPMSMEARILEAEGKFIEAGEQYRNLKSLGLGPGRPLMEKYPTSLITLDMQYARNLLHQQRLMEAEIEARKALLASLAHAGKESSLTGQILTLLTSIVRAQGRLQEAEQLSDAAIRILDAAGTPADSYLMGLARVTKGDIHAVKGDYVGALSQYDLAQAGMKENQFVYERTFAKDPAMILSMLLSGRHDEANTFASRNYEDFRKRFGERHRSTAEMLALKGMAQERLSHLGEALHDLSTATDVLIEQSKEDGGSASRKKLRRVIIDDYIGLLAKIRGTSLEKELGIDVAATAFKLAEANRSSSVQEALIVSSARAAVTEPELADLIRKEQDAGRQISVLENTMLDLLAAPSGQQDQNAVQNLRSNIENLHRARNVILEETKRRFPRYADFVNPPPRSIASIQGLLRPGEGLLSLYATQDQTLVWVIPHRGSIKFSAAAIGRKDLDPLVAKLRKSLDPEPATLGDIPYFDVSLAYDLYARLLSPIEPALENVTDLFIVANRPLDQIPLAILPTAPTQLSREQSGLFAGYREVPWLIRKFSLTMEPSVSALVNLRALPPGDPGRKAFLGFGDPLFNKEQLAMLKTELHKNAEGTVEAVGSLKNAAADQVQVRGIRISAKGTLDNQKITSIRTESLNRLPDTAEEIKTVAQVLNADLTEDVFLREQASERRVKTMPLADRKVVAFATHALVSGDVDGLDQPALALSSPSVTGDQEDGLLTMTDIMKLKLNADWIVLSACNTGAAGGTGAEALSGLGQAFFYAGSRAILASMYPVETTSARKLVTGIFSLQVHDHTLTRSQALRKSMLELIDRESMQDEATGKIVASYAHPIFWAPFVIVGDPGNSR